MSNVFDFGVGYMCSNVISTKMLKLFCRLFLFILLFCDIAFSQTRIMLIGDSITFGVGSSDGLGFRDDLANQLNGAGINFDFVGSKLGAPFECFCEGGRKIEEFYPATFGNPTGSGSFDITSDMNNFLPNVAMVHLGTNDFALQNNSPQLALSEMRELLTYLLQWGNGTFANSLDLIIVSRIIPLRQRSDSRINSFNNELINLVDEFDTGTITGKAENIIIANHFDAFLDNPDLFTGSESDYYVSDKVHPKDLGYLVMGSVYFQTFTNISGASQATLNIVSGNGQTGFLGTRLNDPFVVQLVNSQTHNPIPGSVVRFDVVSGGGFIEDSQPVVTDGQGFASAFLVLGPTPGTNSVSVTAVQFQGVFAFMTATAEGASFFLDEFDRAELGSDYSADSEVRITDGELGYGFNSQKGSWSIIALNRAHTNLPSVTFRYGLKNSTSENGAVGLLVRADRPDEATVNGYLCLIDAVRKEASLWFVQNGGLGSKIGATGNGLIPNAGSVLRIDLSTTVAGHHFKFFLNNSFKGEIIDPNRVVNPSIYYSGVVFENLQNIGRLPEIDRFGFTSGVGPPAMISATSGNSQVALIGSQVPAPLVAAVTDEVGIPVSNVEVNFRIASGDASFIGNRRQFTDSSGNASISVQIGLTPGTVTVLAESQGLQGSPVVFIITAVQGVTFEDDFNRSTVGSEWVFDESVRVTNNELSFVQTPGKGPWSILAIHKSNTNPALVSFRYGNLSATSGATRAVGFLVRAFSPGSATVDENTVTGYLCNLLGNTAALSTITNGNLDEVFIDSESITTTPSAGRVFKVSLSSGSNGPIFDYFLDDQLVARLEDPLIRINSPPNNFAGVAFENLNLLTSVDDFQFLGGAGVPANFILVSGNNQSVLAGGTLPEPIVVQITDKNSLPVPNQPVNFEVTEGGGSIAGVQPVLTDHAGQAAATWTLGEVAGINRVRVTAESGLGIQPINFTAIGFVTIKIESGDNQRQVVGSELSEPFVVQILDTKSDPVLGIPVTFRVVQGDGSIMEPQPVVTNALGLAKVSYTLGNTPGLNKVEAASESGFTQSPVSFMAAGIANMDISSGDNQKGEIGTTLSNPLVGITTNGAGLPVTGIPVSYSILSGEATLGVDQLIFSGDNGLVENFLTLGFSTGTVEVLATTDVEIPGSTVTKLFSSADLDISKEANDSGVGYQLRRGQSIEKEIYIGKENNYVFDVIAKGFGVGGSIEVSLDDKVIGSQDVSSTVLRTYNFVARITEGIHKVIVSPVFKSSDEKIVEDSFILVSKADMRPEVNQQNGTQVIFTVTVLHGPAAIMEVVGGDQQSGVAGTQLENPFVVLITDAFGNPASGKRVDFFVTEGNGTLSSEAGFSDEAGNVEIFLTLGPQLGVNKVTASSTGLEGSPVTFTANGLAGPPVEIILAGGNNQEGIVAVPLPESLGVLVVDSLNNPVENVEVNFVVTLGGGNIQPNSSMTDSSGSAEAIWTLGPLAGRNEAKAISSSLKNSPLTFVATARAGEPAKLTKSSGDGQTAVVATKLPMPLTVVVADSLDNFVKGIEVEFSVVDGTGSVDPGEVQSNVVGQALTFLTLGKTPGEQVVEVKLPNYPEISTAEFTAEAIVGSAEVINVLGGNDQTGFAGEILDEPLIISVTDLFENPIGGINVTFTVLAGGGSVQPAFSATGEDGVALAQWRLGEVGGANRVQVSFSGFTGAPVEFSAVAELRGDIDADGALTIFDLIRVINIILENPPLPSERELLLADLNFDNRIDIFDLVGIENRILGFNSSDTH